MEFKNGYNFLYEKKIENKNKIFASKTGKPEDTDEPIDFGLSEEQISTMKLAYENENGIAISSTGIPSAEDPEVVPTIDGELVFGPKGDVPPTPETLTPFSVGQYISGVDFGDVQNGDISEEMETFFASLGLNSGESLSLVTATDDILTVYAQDFEGTMIYVLTIGEGMVYSTMAFEEVVHGFNNLIDGKLMFKDSFEVSYVNPAEGWNGILVGAVEGQPVSSLTPFKNTDLPYNVSKIVVDLTAMSSDELMNFYNKFNNTTVFVGREDAGAPYIVVDKEDMKCLLIMSATGEDMLIFICESTESFEVGCWYKNEGGQPVKVEELEVMELDNGNDYVGYVKNDAWSDFGDINGKLVGYIPGEEPTPETLTPFSVGQSLGAKSLKVNVNKTTEEVASVIANMEDKTELVNVLYNDSEMPLITIYYNQDGGGKCIAVADSFIFVSDSYEYEDKDTGETVVVPAGWQYDSEEMPIDTETGIVDLSELFTPGMVVEIRGVNSEVTGWNGEIVGYGNEPIPVAFTAFETNDTSDGIDFGNVNNGDTSSSLDSALEDLTEDTYVTFKTNDGISIAGDNGNNLIIYRNEITSTNVILYATGAGTFEGTEYTTGYQNLIDGKYTFDTQKDVITVSDNGKFTAINGTLLGNYKVGE